MHMGLIKAAINAVAGNLADQYKEYIYCESLSNDILAAKGHKRVVSRGTNKGDDNVITDGSAMFAGSTTHQFTGGSNLLSAIIVLAIMILPTVINISVSSIRAVPGHLKSASLALGATHIQTIFKVMIPAARSGIMTGVVLGIGRALGEAMAINLVAGGSVNLPLPFNSVRFLTTQAIRN